MAFKTIRKSSAPEMVAQQIVEKIADGELSPGVRLPSQRELAKMLGVGRSSVREAINALMVMGYLEPIQGKGTFIRDVLPETGSGLEKLNIAFSTGSIFDLMEARELLECHLAGLAAERAEASQINQLRETLKNASKTEKAYDLFLDADIHFHEAVADAANNVVLCELSKLLLEKVVSHHRALKTARLSSAYRETSIRTANRVFEAIESGDREAASRWMGSHLGAIRDELKEIL